MLTEELMNPLILICKILNLEIILRPSSFSSALPCVICYPYPIRTEAIIEKAWHRRVRKTLYW